MGQVVCLAALVGAGWLWRRGRQRFARLIAVVFLAAFVVTTLDVPLGATKLYLFGISGAGQMGSARTSSMSAVGPMVAMAETGGQTCRTCLRV